MPDFGAPVAQNVAPPNFQTLSSLMGIAQGAQNLKLQQQGLQSGALDIQAKQLQMPVAANAGDLAQQTQAVRQKVTQMYQSGMDDQGNPITGADGNPDPAKVLPALGRLGPLAQPMAQDLLKTYTAKVGLQSAALSLDANERQALQGPIQAAGLTNDPQALAAANSAVDAWGQQHPEMAPRVADAKQLLGQIGQVQDPAHRAKLANSLAASFQVGQGVQTQPAGATFNNGQKTEFGTTAPPVAGGAFSPTPDTQPQQQQPAPTTNVTDPNTGGSTLYGARPPLSASSPAVATSVPPMAAGNIEAATNLRKVSNAAAATYPQSQFNNNQIIKLAQSPNALGEGGEVLSKLGGQWAGIPWTSDMSTNYNNIGHFMGLQAMTQMRAAGLAGTDADKSLSQAVTGNQTYTAPSIVNIARVNRALSEGARLYNEGVERAYATGDPSQVTSFNNKWSSAANVDSLLLYNARRSSNDDPGAFDAVVKDMGGKNSPRYKAALQSIDQMKGVISGQP